MVMKLGIGGAEKPFVFYMTLILMWVSVIMLPLVLRRLRPTAESIVLAWASFASWLRPPYLYVVLNVVIVTLGVKSGVLTSSGDAEIVSENSSHSAPQNDLGCSDRLEKWEENQCFSSHLVNVEAEADQAEFICLLRVADGDDNYDEGGEEEEEEEVEEEEEAALSAEELYEKAEVFIGNFYRDLKLQRHEDSWRKIQGRPYSDIR
jgi:hypothetical protein